MMLKRQPGKPNILADNMKVRFTRKNLILRDNSQCQYCGKKLEVKECTQDSILPIGRGGDHSWTNCVIACYDCNRKKGFRTPEEAGMTLLRQPVEPTENPLVSE